MKTYLRSLLTFLLIFYAALAVAQDKADAASLIKQGIALNDAGKYDDAVQKYKQALALEPDNIQAQYETGFTLTVSGKTKDAIPYLEKVAASKKLAEAYDLLASIYDDAKDYEKANAYYKAGIAAFPRYQRLRYNLSVSYLRQKKFQEAEEQAEEAIKLDPKHASSQRAYALAALGQDKAAQSLLAWCNFLLQEPQTSRSVEACKYLKGIMSYGIKRNGNNTNIAIDANSLKAANKFPSQLGMTVAIIAATDSKAGLSPIDSLSLQLTAVFKVIAAQKPDGQPSFFSNFYADYFGKLATTDNMAAFTRYITLSAYKDENLAWFKVHEKEIKAMGDWFATTERKTE